MNLVAAYTRVSTDEQAEHGISLPAQKSRLLSFCQAQGWELYDFYIDDGYSGKNLKRPAMQKMIEDAQLKKFNTVIVIKLDRLSRSQKDVLYLLEDVFTPNRVGFKSATEPFDTTTPFGKAALGMMAVFAQLEREVIVERVRDAKKEAAKQGRFGGGSAPYGYIYNIASKKLEINESQAEIVRTIYDLYLNENCGFQTIANKLNAQGFSGPIVPTWHRDTVKKILGNPFYAGYIPRKEDIHPGKHEPIIPANLWDSAQKSISEKYVPRPVKEPDNLLSGLIFCGNCGARMRFKTQKWHDTKNKNSKSWLKKYYICYSRIGEPRMVKDPNCLLGYQSVTKINDMVIAHLRQVSINPETLEDVTSKVLEKRNTDNSLQRLATAKKELVSLKAKIERWNIAYESGAIEIEDLLKRTKELRERRLIIEANIEELELIARRHEEKIITATEVLKVIKDFPNIWEAATNEERRLLIHNLVQSVVVYPDNVEINLNL